jgi:hypothetical protein
MQKFSIIRLAALSLICILSIKLTACDKQVVVESKQVDSKITEDVKIPYVDIEPVMPNIPKDIGNIAVKDKYGDEGGYGLTLEDIKNCSLDSKSKFVITHYFRDYSENPVVIENIDGTRIIASKKCTISFNSGGMELTDPILSMPLLGVSKSNKYQPISDYGVNSKIRLIQITQDKGGLWSREQMGLLYGNYNK